MSAVWALHAPAFRTPMSLLQLPDDILFNILGFSKPPDLFQLRKTCKRLQALTLERTVWRTAYRNSGSFLPPGPLHSQTVRELEQILLRADRWDKIWLKQDQSVRYTFGCIWSGQCGIDSDEHQDMELAYSRYLIIRGLRSLRVYDLESKCEIFKYQTASNETFTWFDIPRNIVAEGDAAFPRIFTPFYKNSRLGFHKINPEGEIKFIDTEIHTAEINDILAVGYDFCVFEVRRDRTTTSTSLLHISSRKVYLLSSTLEN
ncbi:hypothetical protein GYMLUDRAFT_644316 [Collybiopsis luxurians FD-317 M1]|nr:hypothetical protein GYMLUDRAFT_644316 [Collybiopsis luxurians FD-317 M1]